MYPAYPCLAFNAAISLKALSSLLLGNESARNKTKSTSLTASVHRLMSLIPLWLRRLSFFGLLAITALLGIWRSAGLATAYNAPFKIYSKLDASESRDMTVCVGKEWYRFPSSFFLPSEHGTYRLAFIQSSFHGLLPGPFWESPPGGNGTWFPATSMIPEGMNDKNQEDLGKYVDISQCDYLVDSKMSSWTPNEEEHDYISDAKKNNGEWRIAACEPFLDAAATGFVGRAGWALFAMPIQCSCRAKA